MAMNGCESQVVNEAVLLQCLEVLTHHFLGRLRKIAEMLVGQAIFQMPTDHEAGLIIIPRCSVTLQQRHLRRGEILGGRKPV
jgi:hypothetical protein